MMSAPPIQTDGVLPLVVEASFGLKGQSFCEALTLRHVAEQRDAPSSLSEKAQTPFPLG